MSARIGEVILVEDTVTRVHASTAGVEVHTEARLTYDPISARNYAALLVRGADECERMRGRNATNATCTCKRTVGIYPSGSCPVHGHVGICPSGNCPVHGQSHGGGMAGHDED